MPRRPRIKLAGIPQHIVQRGINREPCFFADEDYHCYLHWLEKAAGDWHCAIHAYVLMTNHVHLLLTAETAEGIAKMMQAMGRRYVQYINRSYRRTGSLARSDERHRSATRLWLLNGRQEMQKHNAKLTPLIARQYRQFQQRHCGERQRIPNPTDKERGMMNCMKLFRRMALGFVLAIVPMAGGCSDNNIITWTEDVKLLDGRVITVTQKRRIEGRMSREAWLTFKLPEFGDREIVWHENLGTQVLNFYQGKLYVIGRMPSIVEFRQYGKPNPSYVGFRYDNGQWVRIPFNEIPEAIYDSNMYFDNMALYRLKHVSLEHKAEMMRDETYMPPIKRVTPKYLITE